MNAEGDNYYAEEKKPQASRRTKAIPINDPIACSLLSYADGKVEEKIPQKSFATEKK